MTVFFPIDVFQIPAPVQYSHLAAYRARQYLINAVVEPMDVKKYKYASDIERKSMRDSQISKFNAAIQVKKEKRSTLYFC